MAKGGQNNFEFNFERVDAWHKAIDFSDVVYRLTQTFPQEERFGLASQMRRAAVSVGSNLAEGSSRSSRTEFVRFIEIAVGSVFEVVAQAEIARRQGFLSVESAGDIRCAASELTRILSGLRRALAAAKVAG